MAGSAPDRGPPDPGEFDAHSTLAIPATAARVPTYPYQVGELILPGYRLEKRLGAGGFGEVWRATAPGGMGVAIKILANLGRVQGGREYRALQTIKNIRHAHIVPLFGVWLKSGDGRVLGEHELVEAERRLLASRGGAWRPEQGLALTVDPAAALDALELIVAMGLGDQTLHDRLKEHQRHPGGPLPAGQLGEWMYQAALALDHFNSGARRSGENLTAVQHCDIKPQNMLLVGDAVQVCDFGLARAQGEVRATANTMASLAYAAPEIVSGRCEPSPATDQYSLAVSYIELRTGKLPYTEFSAGDILRAKLAGTLDLGRLAEPERQVVARALAVDPADRWPTCVAFVRALRAAGAEGEPAVPAAASGAEPPPTENLPAVASPAVTGRRRLWLGLAALVLAGIGAVLVIGPWPPRPTLETARALERDRQFAAAGEAYALALATDPAALAAALWDLQTQAADAGDAAECVPLLRRLERLYAADPPPRVKGISRWDVVNSLAWYLATDPAAGSGAAAEATRLADEGLRLATADGTHRPEALDTAAAAAARTGSFDQAAELMDEAISLTEEAGTRADFERRREAYRAGQAWSEP